ncbi:hypothetical protein SH528x_003468 [Novipirellula sp. SH528]|uniref:hypothetical protein n=1 Tax=Novipirellula sp. SH528 TaxID=3454466 RepID=UPI003FA17935
MRCTTSGEVKLFEVVDHSSPPCDRCRSAIDHPGIVMIQASLISYLKTAQLGPFVPLCARDTVLNLLGSPPYWDGWGGIPCEASVIWVYDSIQFNFDEQMRLADTHIGFESTFNGTSVTYSDWTNSFIQFDDLDLGTISTPDRFRNAMATNQIGTIQHLLSGGRVMIDTDAGVQARFATMTDFEASINNERRIATKTPYLHRLTTVQLAEQSGEREPPMTRNSKSCFLAAAPLPPSLSD